MPRWQAWARAAVVPLRICFPVTGDIASVITLALSGQMQPLPMPINSERISFHVLCSSSRSPTRTNVEVLSFVLLTNGIKSCKF